MPGPFLLPYHTRTDLLIQEELNMRKAERSTVRKDAGTRGLRAWEGPRLDDFLKGLVCGRRLAKGDF